MRSSHWLPNRTMLSSGLTMKAPGSREIDRERVFESFYRIDDARDPNAGGAGLGLPVTRSVVWQHGGDISLNSRKSGGLSVRLELPVGPERVGPPLRRSSSRGSIFDILSTVYHR